MIMLAKIAIWIVAALVIVGVITAAIIVIALIETR
jgi:hypothetical protein